MKALLVFAFISSLVPWADFKHLDHAEEVSLSCCSGNSSQIQKNCCDDVCAHSCCFLKTYLLAWKKVFAGTLNSSSLKESQVAQNFRQFREDILDPPKA